MNYQPHFSHLYIEDELKECSLIYQIVNKNRDAKQVYIQNYKEVFNRSYQNAATQRKSQKLILAKKRDSFVHKTSYFIQNFGYKNIFYVPHLFNCIYDCNYCFLQGMYPSSHVVLFVNVEDYFKEIESMLSQYTPENPLYLCISYDSDLLALEKQVGLVAKWIAFAKGKENLVVESRSKSANYRAISHLEAIPNFIHAWSVLPEVLIQTHDFKTPSLDRRLKAINAAISDGWQVRLSIEPILYLPEYKTVYGAFLDQLFNDIDALKIRDLNIDLFRINEAYLKKMRTLRSDAVLYFPYDKKGSIRSYPKEIADQLYTFFETTLPEYIDMQKVFINKEYV